MNVDLKKILLTIPAIIAVFGVAVFAHGFLNEQYGSQNSYGNSFSWQGMLEHHRIMHDDPNATLEDIQAFHEQRQGSGFRGCRGGCGMFGESGDFQENNFKGCPMHQEFQ